MRDLLSKLDESSAEQPADPMKAAQLAMRKPLAKRFFESITVESTDGGFAVLLDGRSIKTPAGQPIILPEGAARLIADEFDNQVEEIDPATMPAYRLVNTALDGVAADMQAVTEDLLRFSGSDLLCYRADGPEQLVERQNMQWDGPLNWMGDRLGGRFVLAEGVMHVKQPSSLIASFGAVLRQVDDPLRLAALHSMTNLMGSAILAYAVYEGELTAHEAFAAANVDEDWSIEQWGEDHEAMAVRQRRWTEMEAAAALLKTTAK